MQINKRKGQMHGRLSPVELCYPSTHSGVEKRWDGYMGLSGYYKVPTVAVFFANGFDIYRATQRDDIYTKKEKIAQFRRNIVENGDSFDVFADVKLDEKIIEDIKNKQKSLVEQVILKPAS